MHSLGEHVSTQKSWDLAWALTLVISLPLIPTVLHGPCEPRSRTREKIRMMSTMLTRMAPERRKTIDRRRQRCEDVFGSNAKRIPVSSSKGVLGHGLGAAGAFEMAATALALHRQTIPPTANFEEVDPDCDLDVVPNIARQAEVNVAMSNSFAFGGLNAVLLASRA